ncbi:zinc-ribbon domain-containing protein [Lactiplantibacillus plantarum]|uniref:zinc-ribbon domain-containing protein n=1 Tax=Lactiplantibacillus plantarum TaxID=1590 RepID=UPI00398C6512
MKLCKITMFTKCPYCGYENKENWNYCEHCGSPLGSRFTLRGNFFEGFVNSISDPSQTFLILQAILLVVLLVMFYL